MKFKPVQVLKVAAVPTGTVTFEPGNTYDTALYSNVGNLDGHIAAWHKNGLCEVEGKEKVPLRAAVVDTVTPDVGSV